MTPHEADPSDKDTTCRILGHLPEHSSIFNLFEVTVNLEKSESTSGLYLRKILYIPDLEP